MNFMFCNVRGLGNPVKRRMITEIIRDNKINFVCQEEIKLIDPDIKVLKSIAPSPHSHSY